MKKTARLIGYIMCCILISSCVDVEYDCGPIETKITALGMSVGSYTSDLFTTDQSQNFEEAAIQIQIAGSMMVEECKEYTFTPVPQFIESIEITSAGNIKSGGIDYAAGASLNQLFRLYSFTQVYSISEFITAQNNDPLLFYSDSGRDRIILQLSDKPDISISQPFTILFTFTDSEILSVEVPNFEVNN